MSKGKPAHDEKHRFGYGERVIEFSLRFSSRKSLSIAVHPDMRVEVRAPEGKGLGEVLEKMQRRAAWIAKHLDRFECYQPLPTERKYISGETHFYLGRQYRLKVADASKEMVKLAGSYLYVHARDRQNRNRIRRLVENWYGRHAKALFERHVQQCQEVARKAGIPEPRYQVRRMRKRWASCSGKGLILLNTELIKAPVHCIDYVIMHELCHLVERNHGPRFRRLLSRLIPDWEQRKARLDGLVVG